MAQTVVFAREGATVSVRALVQVPQRVRAGERVTIRATLGHPMESGHRRGATGELLARDIIRHFSCTYLGEPVFSAQIFPAVSANPYLAFMMIAERSGELTLRWRGDHGFTHEERVWLNVE